MCLLSRFFFRLVFLAFYRQTHSQSHVSVCKSVWSALFWLQLNNVIKEIGSISSQPEKQTASIKSMRRNKENPKIASHFHRLVLASCICSCRGIVIGRQSSPSVDRCASITILLSLVHLSGQLVGHASTIDVCLFRVLRLLFHSFAADPIACICQACIIVSKTNA